MQLTAFSSPQCNHWTFWTIFFVQEFFFFFNSGLPFLNEAVEKRVALQHLLKCLRLVIDFNVLTQIFRLSIAIPAKLHCVPAGWDLVYFYRTLTYWNVTDNLIISMYNILLLLFGENMFERHFHVIWERKHGNYPCCNYNSIFLSWGYIWFNMIKKSKNIWI